MGSEIVEHPLHCRPIFGGNTVQPDGEDDIDSAKVAKVLGD
jgi:hypothetical protein